MRIHYSTADLAFGNKLQSNRNLRASFGPYFQRFSALEKALGTIRKEALNLCLRQLDVVVLYSA
jgi:hypothetical protein